MSVFYRVELTIEMTKQNWPDQVKYLGEEYSVLSGNSSNNWSASWLWGGNTQNACRGELAPGGHFSPSSFSLFHLLSPSTTLSSVSLPSSSFLSFLSKWWGHRIKDKEEERSIFGAGTSQATGLAETRGWGWEDNDFSVDTWRWHWKLGYFKLKEV